jgi:hypothetical protein
LRFTDIYILESLDGGFAARTGRRLLEELEALTRGSSRDVHAHYDFIFGKADLFDKLRQIAVDSKTRPVGPVLHLETHGNPEGLGLASGEFASWEELQPALTEINVVSHVNLVVMVAACNGLDLLKILQPTDPAVARLIIGPNRTLTAGEVETANRAFYRVLFETFDGFRAYRAMNDAIEPPSATRRQVYHALSAENMFQMVMRAYFRTECTPERLAARVEDHVAYLARRGMGAQDLTYARAIVQAEYSNHRAVFEHYRQLYFCCDLHPEIDARFNASFEDCWPSDMPE